MTTKILALTDALGNLVRVRLMPGQRHGSVEVPPLIDGLTVDGLIADKASDSNTLIADLNRRGAKVVIYQVDNQHLKVWREKPDTVFRTILCTKVNDQRVRLTLGAQYTA